MIYFILGAIIWFIIAASSFGFVAFREITRPSDVGLPWPALLVLCAGWPIVVPGFLLWMLFGAIVLGVRRLFGERT